MNCVLCSVFWWLGDVTSKVMCSFPRREWWSRSASHLYPVYNQLMLWSVNRNDRGNCGRWGPALGK